MIQHLTVRIMLIVLLAFLAFSSNAQTDTSKPYVNSPAGGSEKVLFAGAAVAHYQYTAIQDGQSKGSFSPVTLFAIPLIKVSNRLFMDFAAEFDENLNDFTGGATFKFDELVVYYRITPWMYLFGGSFTPKFGVYYGVLDDFTNRFGTGVPPVGMGYGPVSACGLGIQGAVQAGYSKLYYQLYTSNGPQLDTTTGRMNYGSFIDNNSSKNVGWAIGYLPFSNSCLEVNFSGAYTPETGNTGTPYQNVSNLSWALGLNYYHLFHPIMIRAIGQYDGIQTSKYNYHIQTSDTTSTPFTFNNNYNGWFYGMTIRDAGSNKIFLRRLELAARIGAMNPPSGAPWGGNPFIPGNNNTIDQTTITLTYWINWDIPLNLEYDILTQNGASNRNIFTTTIFYRF